MVRILTFGDSIVSEELNLGFKYWATLLRDSLRRDTVMNLGRGGETTTSLVEKIDMECKTRTPDVIIIGVGVNDSRYNNKTKESVETPEEEFKKNIKEIAEICKEYTPKVIFVEILPVDESKTMPTPWGEGYYSHESIKEYNKIIKSICNEENILFLELFEDWINKDYPNLLNEEDGLHPNKKGHEEIFKSVKDFLEKNKIIK